MNAHKTTLVKRLLCVAIASIFSITLFGQHPKKGMGAVLLSPDAFNHFAKYARPNKIQAFTSPATFIVPAPPPGDQLTEGSCVAWSVGYTWFSSYLRRHLPVVWNPGTEISPGFVYHFIKLTNDCASGSNVPRAIVLLQNIGACLLRSWPYVDNDCNQAPTIPQEAEAAQFRSPWGDPQATNDPVVQAAGGQRHPNGVVELWKALDPKSVADYKAFLQQYNWPIIVAFNVNTSFETMWYDNGIWTQNSGSVIGGHSVCVIGWDDNKTFNGKTGMFKCQNQWGTQFGDNGYFWVSYDLITSGCFPEAYGWVRDEPAAN